MRITRVYTKTGDKGKTRLAGGQPVWKDAVRVEAYGTVDELNASLGVVRALWLVETKGPIRAEAERELRWMQNKLFDIGGLLATAPGQSFLNMPRVEAQDVTRLESLIDGWQKDLKPLKEFILPGGGTVASSLHLARTICRRAERCCVSLMRKEPVDVVIITYLNRLSDALFVLARWVALRLGEKELLWERTGAHSHR
jgi:cob(I)alamin adenosyltransferase